jgi:hypothetical protein
MGLEVGMIFTDGEKERGPGQRLPVGRILGRHDRVFWSCRILLF